MSALFRASIVAICLLVARTSSAQLAPVYGAESPQALMAAMATAIAADDFSAVLPLISPAGRKELAEDAITGLILALNFLDPDSKASASKPVPDAEREARRRRYRAAVDVARQTLQPHRLDGLIGQPPLAAATKDIVELALANTDTVVLMRSLFAALERIGALLNLERGSEKKMPWTFGTVTDYQVTGDHATAKADAETIEFERVAERWYLKPPSK